MGLGRWSLLGGDRRTAVADDELDPALADFRRINLSPDALHRARKDDDPWQERITPLLIFCAPIAFIGLVLWIVAILAN